MYQSNGVISKAVLGMALGLQASAGLAAEDFGQMVDRLLRAKANSLMGVSVPLAASAPATSGAYRSLDQSALDQVALAVGLRVEYLTREAGNSTDMMAFYPLHRPTHLISCVEGGREVIGTLPGGGDKYNPSIQRIELSTGKVETVLRGMDRCDGIRTTAWGTILATEETDDGGAYELLDPLGTTEETVLDRGFGQVSAPDEVAKRAQLPTMAWEGLTVLANGIVIGGDELRPGSEGPDTDGGAIFKFVPSNPRLGDSMITALDQSPLVAGSVYAMVISCRDTQSSAFPQFGQGCEIGQGTWLAVNAATARLDANSVGATGYYRPEDLHGDPLYADPDHIEAVRFCWTNTGNEDGDNFAEVVCAVDFMPGSAQSVVSANRFVEGDPEFNSFDNLAFQPGTGNLYVVEDHDNGDIFACLPDGGDRDIKSDGCVRILSVKDSSAEPTGFLFSDDGKTAYVSIQHSRDDLMPLVDDYPSDDVLRISGFRLRKH